MLVFRGGPSLHVIMEISDRTFYLYLLSRVASSMPVTTAQRSAVQEVIDAIKSVSSPKKKRNLSELFLELVDKKTWANYYEVRVKPRPYLAFPHTFFTTSDKVIPQPRCLNGVSQKLLEGSYNDPSEVYDDLSLVFLNALYYNQPTSQIHKDAATLKVTSPPVS
jgi:chromatin structure-remodeling complex subunit RSC1/2